MGYSLFLAHVNAQIFSDYFFLSTFSLSENFTTFSDATRKITVFPSIDLILGTKPYLQIDLEGLQRDVVIAVLLV